MAYEPPPPFMPYEPFLLGVGVVFNLLNGCSHHQFPATSSGSKPTLSELASEAAAITLACVAVLGTSGSGPNFDNTTEGLVDS